MALNWKQFGWWRWGKLALILVIIKLISELLVPVYEPTVEPSLETMLRNSVEIATAFGHLNQIEFVESESTIERRFGSGMNGKYSFRLVGDSRVGIATVWWRKDNSGLHISNVDYKSNSGR